MAVRAVRLIGMVKVSEEEKKSVRCPKCNVRRGEACTAYRIGSANSFGGGWGNYVVLERSHVERRAAFIASKGVK